MKMMIFFTMIYMFILILFSKQNFFSFLMTIEMYFLMFIFFLSMKLIKFNFWNMYFWYFIIITMSAIGGIYMMIFNTRMLGKISISFIYD